MCTAVTFNPWHRHYFGRNLDLEVAFGESVVVTPRNAPLPFRNKPTMQCHFAIIGMAVISENYPLYFDATNEYGLSMAALNFPGNAFYFPFDAEKDNIAPFEFIPWILGQCKDLQEVREHLKSLNLIACAFGTVFPITPLHWIIADKEKAITVESTKSGLIVYDNSPGVLTNNPPYSFHIQNLSMYLNLTREEPTNRFCDTLDLPVYSRGMGGIGLPGDLSSPSRFTRAAFTKLNSVVDDSSKECICQFFHILSAVEQPKGCVAVGDKFESTIYSSCCDMDRCIYYYKTYSNSRITAVDLFRTDLNAAKLLSFPLRTAPDILFEN